ANALAEVRGDGHGQRERYVHHVTLPLAPASPLWRTATENQRTAKLTRQCLAGVSSRVLPRPRPDGAGHENGFPWRHRLHLKATSGEGAWPSRRVLRMLEPVEVGPQAAAWFARAF